MFGGFTALKNVSLEIFEGEFICFLGPSGCGKTTLLRAIAGLDIQTSGSVEQGGKDISNLPSSERDFGIVFQSYALFPNLNISRNVGYGLENRNARKDEIKARVSELLELVGMPEQGKKYPAQLSGGQQQRVALARALATKPGLLLLDEPLSALDAKVRGYLRLEIKQLQHILGVTTIMVTHDQEEALTMADRIVVMNEGAIDQVGSPLEIYRHPTSPFVADFVGTMNFLGATVITNEKIRVGGSDIHLENTLDNLTIGSSVTVCVRPEDVIARDIESGADNIINVVVNDLEFLGSFYRARLRLKGEEGSLLLADFSINLVRDVGIEEGKSIQVLLPASRLRIFSDSESSA